MLGGNYQVSDIIEKLRIRHAHVATAGYLVTWSSDEETTARKYKNIEWEALPRRHKTNSGSITVDIPAGAKMYLPHLPTKEWAKQALKKY